MRSAAQAVGQFVEFSGLHGSISGQKPAWSKRQCKKSCCICQWKSSGKLIFLMNHLLNCTPITVNVAQDVLDPAGTQHSPRKQGRKESWFGITPSLGCVRDLQSGWQHQQFQAPRESCSFYIPNRSRGRILQQDGALVHTLASTSRLLKAKMVSVFQDWTANMSVHVWGGGMKEQAWKTRPKNGDELWESC